MDHAAALGVGLVVALLASTWLTHGIDVTDQGFLLSNAQRIARNSESYEYSVTWLSDLVGGLWLQLAGDPGVLWARWGMVVATGMLGALVFHALRQRFRTSHSALATIASASLLRINPGEVLDYMIVPLLCLLPACILLYPRATAAGEPRRSTMACVLAGSLVGVATMARLTAAVAVLLPCIGPAVQFLVGTPRRPGELRAFCVASAATGLVVLGSLACLDRVGRLDEYLSIFTGRSGFGTHEAYSVGSMLRLYAEQLMHVLAFGLILSGLLLAALSASARFRSEPRKSTPQRPSPLTTIAAGSMAAGLGVGLAFSARWGDHRVALVSIVLLGSVLVVLVERYLVPADARREDPVTLLGVGLYLAFCVSAGSATGLKTLRDGVWLVLPALMLVLPGSARALAARWPALSTGGRVHRWAAPLAVLGVVLVGQALRSVSPYRDARDPRSRDTALAHPMLRGVVTTEGRALSVEQMLSALMPRVQPGDSLIAYGDLCLVYYVTRTNPSLGQVWADEMNVRLLRERLAELGARRPLPAVAVRARRSMKSRDWGSSRQVGAEDPDGAEQVALIDARLRELDFEEVWSNRDFLILAPRGSKQGLR